MIFNRSFKPMPKPGVPQQGAGGVPIRNIMFSGKRTPGQSYGNRRPPAPNRGNVPPIASINNPGVQQNVLGYADWFGGHVGQTARDQLRQFSTMGPRGGTYMGGAAPRESIMAGGMLNNLASMQNNLLREGYGDQQRIGGEAWDRYTRADDIARANEQLAYERARANEQLAYERERQSRLDRMSRADWLRGRQWAAEDRARGLERDDYSWGRQQTTDKDSDLMRRRQMQDDATRRSRDFTNEQRINSALFGPSDTSSPNVPYSNKVLSRQLWKKWFGA